MATYTYDQLRAMINNPNARAFGRFISEMEGSSGFANPYLAAGGTSNRLLKTGFVDHPYNLGKQYVWQFRDKSGQVKNSTAHGKYMMKQDTWNWLKNKYGIPDFSPVSQDVAFLARINEVGGLDDLMKGNWKSLFNKVAPVWSSLPNTLPQYNQHKRSWDFAYKAMKKHGINYEGVGVAQGANGSEPDYLAMGNAYLQGQGQPQFGNAGEIKQAGQQESPVAEYLKGVMNGDISPVKGYEPSNADIAMPKFNGWQPVWGYRGG